ncbi:Gfo/Idh/MocA family oxidoreductase [Microbacterium sp. ISL-108]|nr:Gfo/Idh/MocA family oxidoreductase [Microbacterium sp. ISL-108]
MSGPLVRWGIVGTGSISEHMTADLQMVDNAEVGAVTSRDKGRAREFGDKCGIESRYSSLADMLDSDIDAVYIGTPHITHFDIAAAAIDAGRHVLCEKPIGMTAAEVRELRDRAAKRGVFIMEAMWMKFNPLFVQLVDLVVAGRIGEVHSGRGGFGIPFPQDGSSRWKPGGSALLDQGIYPVTLAHMFLGQPDEVTARGVVRPDGVDLSEHFTLDYADGRYFQGAVSMTEWLDLSASISGSHGWITIDGPFWAATSLTIHTYDHTGEVRVPVAVHRKGYGYVPMLRAVTEAISRGQHEHPLHTMDAAAGVFDTLGKIRDRLATQPNPSE